MAPLIGLLHLAIIKQAHEEGERTGLIMAGVKRPATPFRQPSCEDSDSVLPLPDWTWLVHANLDAMRQALGKLDGRLS